MTIDYINLNFKKKTASVDLRAVFFNDNGHYIMYIPSLQLTSYGDSKKEALDLMHTTVVEYLRELIRQAEPVATKELEQYGFKRNPLLKKRFVSEAYIDKEGILENFNLPADTTLVEETKLETAA